MNAIQKAPGTILSRGIFGSHVANVLRRQQRTGDQYGSPPRPVGCPATIANFAERASRLVGRELTLLDNDGSPKGQKFFVFWNPHYLPSSPPQG